MNQYSTQRREDQRHAAHAPELAVEIQREFDTVSKQWQERVFVKLYVAARTSGLLAAIPDREWKTLCALATFMDVNGNCNPSQDEIARCLGVDRATATRRLAALCAFKWRGQPLVAQLKVRGQDGKFECNQYTILPLAGLSFGPDKQSGPIENHVTKSSHGSKSEPSEPCDDVATWQNSNMDHRHMVKARKPKPGAGCGDFGGVPSSSPRTPLLHPEIHLQTRLKDSKNNDDRNREAVAKNSTVYGTARACANAAPPPAAVVVAPTANAQDNVARPPLIEQSMAAATSAVKAGHSVATACGGSGLDSAGGGQDQQLRGPGDSDLGERVRARYREVAGLDDLRPAFARKLIARHGAAYVEEKLALLETWLRDKRAAGERVTPLRAFLDALRHDWPAPAPAPRRDEVAETRRRLEEYERAAREAAPREVALAYMRQIRETLRKGGGP